MPASIDHFVIAGTDLSAVVAWWAATSGQQPAAGGAHRGSGTRNALVGLGANTYLELIGPDPEQADHVGPRPFGINELEPNSIQLVTFALAVDDLDGASEAVRSAGIDPGRIVPMQRVRPDGVELSWRLAVPPQPSLGGVMPFLIEWGSGTRHPASSLASGCTIEQITLTHPDPGPIQAALRAIGADGGPAGLSVGQGPKPSVGLHLRTPNGSIDL